MIPLTEDVDVLIIGAGVIGIAIGISLLELKPDIKVTILEKEMRVGLHASGRNSGVLHAGFYYSPDSLKARYCRIGNLELRKVAKKHGIRVQEVGKVVVSQNNEENLRLDVLFKRGIENGVDLELKDSRDLIKFEPLAQTHDKFIWSPTTAVSDPHYILEALLADYIKLGGKIEFNSRARIIESNQEIHVLPSKFAAKHIVNCAGAYAEKISHSVGVGLEYSMLPIMGVYRQAHQNSLKLRRLVYPVPNSVNPFLGVHVTLTTDDNIKIGPTAIPIIGKEQYSPLASFSPNETYHAGKSLYALLMKDVKGTTQHIKMEFPKIFEKYLIKKSSELVPALSQIKKWEKKPPGIRAQLVNLSTGEFELDFVVKNYKNSTHILNAVSPGWTCALPFGRDIARDVLTRM
jgi:L-2-hydroxyglutarate oxidase